MRELSLGLTVDSLDTVQYEMNGRVADSMLVNTALMLIYITKFFWWESGYWCTMDIAHDRGTQLYYRFKLNNFFC
jgi:7-dehydrocholesterol reductase